MLVGNRRSDLRRPVGLASGRRLAPLTGTKRADVLGHSVPRLSPEAGKEKGQSIDWPISLFLCGNLARPERFERPTPWFVAKYSIQLSYGRAAERQNYSTLFQHCNHFLMDGCFGGEGGIRTLDTGFSPYAPLAGECLRPLGHLSVYCVLQSARTIPVSPAPVKSARNLFQPLTAPAGPVRMRGAARARPVRGTSRRAPPTP